MGFADELTRIGVKMDFSWVVDLFAHLPFECMESRFMRQALWAILLLTPMAAMLGAHVLSFRMAFFSDAVGHSAFAGLALGLILGAPPQAAVMVFGVIIGLAIMAVQRRSGLSADAAIGIVFSAVVAFGLAVVSRSPDTARAIQQYLYGDILTVSQGDLAALGLMLPIVASFEFFGWNKMLLLALSPTLARVDGEATALWQYTFAALLALVVMFSVRVVGVLLVTALLVVPAATAANLARDIRGMFWWGLAVSVFSGVSGLLLSAQEWLSTASGAAIILVACLCFALSCIRKKTR